MKILLVDGNEKEASDRYIKMGMDTQFEVYKKILKKKSKDSVKITLIHPAVQDEYLPAGVSLDDFDAVVWTGSLLNIYDHNKSIIKQIPSFFTILLHSENTSKISSYFKCSIK